MGPDYSSVLRQFQRTGCDLFSHGLISSHGGNASVRLGSKILITCHGSMLGHLTRDDLVDADLPHHISDRKPSIELVVHRAIYQQTQAAAIIHAHPAHAIALSFLESDIVPADIEGSYLLQRVPVIGKGVAPASPELAGVVAESLKHSPVAVVHGHGSFARGESLEEALQWTSALEESSRILCWLRAFGIAPRKAGPG